MGVSYSSAFLRRETLIFHLTDEMTVWCFPLKIFEINNFRRFWLSPFGM